jgi:oligopeptide transport system substrate-binding protein
LEEILFIPITDGATAVSLYKSGNAHAMHGRAVPPLWIPALRDHKDFHRVPAYRSYFYPFNTTRPPFNNPLVRYAFQMATDKGEIVRFLSGGQAVARGVVPPSLGYESPQSLLVDAGGRPWDVLSYDPAGARELMRLAGAGRLVFDLTFPIGPRSKEIAQILQTQWHANLGAEVRLIAHETNVWIQALQEVAYRGMIECNWTPPYVDPYGIMELFNGRSEGSGWKDPEFRKMLDRADAEPDAVARLRKLAACEQRLLRAMPVLPLFFDSYAYLTKPYVQGMTPKVLDVPEYKDIWIDTNWKPS